MIKLFSDGNDDLQYIESIEHIINGAATSYQPAGIYIVRIRGWFDHKWVGFSGKALGQLGVWNSPITLPPFHPHRVLSQRYYHWDPGEECYVRATGWARLHKYQRSSDNFRRRLGRVARSAMYVWFCSDTQEADKSSLMIYVRTRRCSTSWFVSFAKVGSEWKMQTKNISPTEIDFFYDTGKRLEAQFYEANPHAEIRLKSEPELATSPLS